MSLNYFQIVTDSFIKLHLIVLGEFGQGRVSQAASTSIGITIVCKLIIAFAFLSLTATMTGAVGVSFAETLVFPPYGHSYGIRKATPKHLFMFFGPRTFFDNPQGLATCRLTVWDDTTKESDDDEVVVYGVNCNRHQIIYNTSMWTLGLFGKKGSGDGRFLFPKGIAANRHGDVFVADSGNNRIVQLFNPKSKLQWVRSFNGARGDDMGLGGPSRVTVDEDRRVYATDPGNNRILIFDASGKRLREITTGRKPTALIAADGRARWSKFRHEKFLYYAEDGGRWIVKSTFGGKTLLRKELPEGHTAVYGATDYYHNYWITDTEKHCVLKYDHHFNLLEVFGAYGKKDNQFVEPRGIAIYKRYGQVFIAEKSGAQYYWVGTDLKNASLTPSEHKRHYKLEVNATEYSYASLFSVFDGDTNYYIQRRRIPPSFARLYVNDKGRNLTEENIILRLEPTYSSYTYNAWFYPLPVKRTR